MVTTGQIAHLVTTMIKITIWLELYGFYNTAVFIMKNNKASRIKHCWSEHNSRKCLVEVIVAE